MAELRKLSWLLASFLAAYFVPFGHPRVSGAILEACQMLQEYARQHVLLCLVPALFIAGAISVFVSQASVIKYFSGQARKWLSYSVASVSGTILAVCSCTVLPLFAGIYQRGEGLGPAVAFLYSGPAINVLAIILTARVLGWKLGLARALGAVLFSVVIGLVMAFIYRREERERTEAVSQRVAAAIRQKDARSGAQNLLYFAAMVGILVFANWGKPAQPVGFWNAVFGVKWYVAGALLVLLIYMLARWFRRDELSSWLSATWGFAGQIIPLLFAGVLAAGVLMGRPGTDAGLIPSRWIEAAVGGNSLRANLVKFKDGSTNYSDLIPKGGKKPSPEKGEPSSPRGLPLAFEVGGVRILNSHLGWKDETTGNDLGVDIKEIKTGRLAEKQPAPVTLEASIKGVQPKLDLVAKAGGTLTFDLAEPAYSFSGLSVNVTGAAVDFSNVAVTLTGDVVARGAKPIVQMTKLNLEAKGARGKDAFQVKVSAPAVQGGAEAVKIESLKLR